MTKQFSPPPSINQGGGLFVPIQDRGESGVPRISDLMCCSRKGGSVMGSRLSCINGLKALLCLAKGCKDASWGEVYGGVVGLGGILGKVFPSL